MASILTNAGAFTALRVLEQTNRSLGTTQDRIATGLKVATSKDNASFWAVAATMKSDVAAFKSITDNLSLATNAASVARDGAQQISELVKEIKSKATSAQEGSLDKSKMQADIDNALTQIDEIVNSAQFNGVNLLKDSKEMRYLSSIVRGDSVDPSYIKFDTQDLARSGGLSMLDGLSVLGRGDSIYKSSTNGSATAIFDLDGDTADAGANDVLELGATGLASGSTLTFVYKDGQGIERTVEVKTTEALAGTNSSRDLSEKFVKQLNSSAQIRDNFTVEIASDNKIKVTAKDRDSGVEFTSIKAGAGTAITQELMDQQVVLEFNDEPLRLGEEFTFTHTAADTDYDIVFRVSDNDMASGSLLDASGTRIVVSLDAREVSQSFTTGSKIATEVLAALDRVTKASGAGDWDNTQAGVTDDQIAAANAIQTALSTAGSNLWAGTPVLSAAIDTTDKYKITITNTAGASTELLKGFKAPVTDYGAILKNVDDALDIALNAAASLGSAQKRIEIQQDFLKGMVDNLNVGIGTLVDANMNEESARLQALQVQQQLGIQALSIANQSPQSLLSLFR